MPGVSQSSGLFPHLYNEGGEEPAACLVAACLVAESTGSTFKVHECHS